MICSEIDNFPANTGQGGGDRKAESIQKLGAVGAESENTDLFEAKKDQKKPTLQLPNHNNIHIVLDAHPLHLIFKCLVYKMKISENRFSKNGKMHPPVV